MKHFIKFFTLLFIVSGNIICQGQEIQTLLDSNRVKSSGGYGALTNKFTSIGGQFANLTGMYGGWYINHKFMLGVSGASVTNNIPVPSKFNSVPDVLMSYEYGQFGFMSEYVLKSNKLMHLSFQLFAGMGFNTQYNRYADDNEKTFTEYRKSTDWYLVTEPGVNVELNILKWMRFCPGVSYRLAMETGSPVNGLKAGDISGASINAALKFGKF